MLSQLRLQNFRCFDDHVINFKPTTIIVGRNNAGKSTIVEALRLVSIVVNRYQSLNYRDVPNWLDLPRRMRGVSPDLGGVDFSLETTFHRYGQPPAIITATFSDNSSVAIYLGRESSIHAVIASPIGEAIKSKGEANKTCLPRVSIMPQVAPVARDERLLSPDYVRSAMSSHLAPLHFRNQLWVLSDLFSAFSSIAQETWPGLRILDLTSNKNLPGEPLYLLVQNDGFVAEVAAMGHGLQMWLQTMWFLTRSQDDPAVILDEPDVYMHADLQRRLIRFLRNQKRQVIVTTHSVEIMAEVDAEEILVIDRSKSQSKFATSLPSVQRLVEHIGSVHNIHLVRVWGARRCIFVEGKDIEMLKIFQNTLFPESQEPFDAIPNMSIGGWGGWNYVVGSSMLLKNTGGDNIITYCIFDRDYHTEEEVEKRRRDAKARGVQLHIWQKKEIENYLICPATILRVIESRAPKASVEISLEVVVEIIEGLVESMKDEVFDALSTELLAQNKAQGVPKANQIARQIVNEKWTTLDGRMSLISGKTLVTQLSKWSQQQFGVSLSAKLLARNMRRDEIPVEMVDLVSAVEAAVEFP